MGISYFSSVSKDPFNLSCMHHFSTPCPQPLIVCMHTHNVLDFSNKIYILFLLSAWLSEEGFPLPVVSHQTYLNGPFRTSTSMLMSACSWYATYMKSSSPQHFHTQGFRVMPFVESSCCIHNLAWTKRKAICWNIFPGRNKKITTPQKILLMDRHQKTRCAPPCAV